MGICQAYDVFPARGNASGCGARDCRKTAGRLPGSRFIFVGRETASGLGARAAGRLRKTTGRLPKDCRKTTTGVQMRFRGPGKRIWTRRSGCGKTAEDYGKTAERLPEDYYGGQDAFSRPRKTHLESAHGLREDYGKTTETLREDYGKTTRLLMIRAERLYEKLLAGYDGAARATWQTLASRTESGGRRGRRRIRPRFYWFLYYTLGIHPLGIDPIWAHFRTKRVCFCIIPGHFPRV